MFYRSEDIGGFFRPDDQYTSPDYHNLLVRWFQVCMKLQLFIAMMCAFRLCFHNAFLLLKFGSFTPIYRVHGGGSRTEIWNYGPDVEVQS